MLLTIILILSFLVAFNFLLLFFSCNKTSKIVEERKPHIIRNNKSTTVSNQLPTSPLAPTGS